MVPMTMTTARVLKVAAPLRQQVTEVLRTAIHEGRFLPGGRLGEKELCDYTGVSRTSVREAIRQLEAEGYVHMVPNKGPVVAVIGEKEARSIYQLRAALEGLASRLFAENATAQQKQRLRRALQRLEAAIPKQDRQAWLPAITEFYEVLAEGARNEPLAGVLKTLQGRTTRLRATSVQSPGRMRKSCDEIKAIVEAIDAGNARKAEIASVVHVEQAAKVALQVIRAAEPIKAPMT
jgi:GntR family transcriptional regulator, trigonelline degradation regulator